MLDYEGYPTDENLLKIKEWDMIRDPYGLVEFLRDNWWMPEWGFKIKGRRLELHTGGWSGNEDTIRQLQETFFFTFYWQKSVRGGHYYFELPKRKLLKNDLTNQSPNPPCIAY